MEKINLFFAIDDNYCPFLSSSVHSILKNANKNYKYDIYVLHHGMSNDNKEIITNQIKNDACIEFVNVLEFVDMKEFALDEGKVVIPHLVQNQQQRLLIEF